MNGYVLEQLENLRRTAEAGLRLTQAEAQPSAFIDTFQHIIDEVERTKNYIERDIR